MKISLALSSRRFTSALAILAAIWFLLVYPYLLWNQPKLLPQNAAPDNNGQTLYLPVDFDQYYLGGWIAKNGEWNNLYPTPNPEVYDVPSSFRPKIKSFLFNYEKIKHNNAYYPSLAYPSAASYPPEMIAKLPEISRYSHNFFYPPPLALILTPLAYFDSITAGYKIWPIICVFALFGTCIVSARIYRILHDGPSYTEGFLIIFFVLFSIFGYTTVSTGNANPILGFLITVCAYAWINNKEYLFGWAVIPLILFKGIGLNWCPLLVTGKWKCKSLLIMTLLTVALNGIVLYSAGKRVYSEFFFNVIPKVGVPLGDGIVARVFKVLGWYPKTLYLGILTAGVLGICYLYWKRQKDTTTKEMTPVILAGLAGGIALFCLFNFSSYMIYLYHYLYFPFLGWLVWEYKNSFGLWHYVALISLLTGASWILNSAFHLDLDWDPTQTTHLFLAIRIISRSCIYVCLVSIFAMAMRRLYMRPPYSLNRL